MAKKKKNSKGGSDTITTLSAQPLGDQPTLVLSNPTVTGQVTNLPIMSGDQVVCKLIDAVDETVCHQTYSAPITGDGSWTCTFRPGDLPQPTPNANNDVFGLSIFTAYASGTRNGSIVRITPPVTIHVAVS
jgi:hypothetical protein